VEPVFWGASGKTVTKMEVEFVVVVEVVLVMVVMHCPAVVIICHAHAVYLFTLYLRVHEEVLLGKEHAHNLQLPCQLKGHNPCCPLNG